MVLQAIKYARGELKILDQLKLPYQEVFIEIDSPEQAWYAIKDMKVRGAPAIAIVAALSVAVWAHNDLKHNADSNQNTGLLRQTLEDKLNYLETSRPTAVNLADAVRKLKTIIRGTSPILDTYIEAAEQMLADDVSDNEKIGRNGSQWIAAQAAKVAAEESISVITHCNTGSLATAGYGTALGVVRHLHSSKLLKRVYYTETRPYNQGSRLTGYELIHDNIPATLITDSMAAALMRLKSKTKTESIAAVVVGADRVVANGDTANKIGTYSLAILARHHGIKFVVAAPRTTVDLETKSGDEIIIEERNQTEVTRLKGPVVNDTGEVGRVEEISTAAAKTEAWNPSFDVTPSDLIDAIVTEVGVVEKNDEGVFDLRRLIENAQ